MRLAPLVPLLLALAGLLSLALATPRKDPQGRLSHSRCTLSWAADSRTVRADPLSAAVVAARVAVVAAAPAAPQVATVGTSLLLPLLLQRLPLLQLPQWALLPLLQQLLL